MGWIRKSSRKSGNPEWLLSRVMRQPDDHFGAPGIITSELNSTAIGFDNRLSYQQSQPHSLAILDPLFEDLPLNLFGDSLSVISDDDLHLTILQSGANLDQVEIIVRDHGEGIPEE